MAKQMSRPLFIYTIVSIIVLYVGLICSSIFWATLVNKQFGLIIPFTFLFLLCMNIFFKIPAFIDLILLIVNRAKPVVYLIVIFISLILTTFIDLVLIMMTEGSKL